MISFVTFRELREDAVEFASRFHGQVDLVAGAPRSGTLVANLIALHLNVPCTTIDGLERGEVWPSGPRLKTTMPKSPRVLLVDDSALSGSSLAKSLAGRSLAWEPTKIGVLYASQKIANEWRGNSVRSFLRVVPSPRIFAWNWPHASMTRHIALDFDGVICRDPTTPEDDEAGYIDAITNAPPLYIPTWPIGGIVTHRLERRREITRDWLKRHRVAVTTGPAANLVMYPAQTCRERRAARKQDGTWKGSVYKSRPWHLFVESDPRQSAKIFEVSGKPVYCPATDRLWKKSGG